MLAFGKVLLHSTRFCALGPFRPLGPLRPFLSIQNPKSKIQNRHIPAVDTLMTTGKMTSPT